MVTKAVFDTMPEAAQQQAVAAALRGRRHLLIVDNLESVTAAPLAIPHSLDAARRLELQAFLKTLVGGRTLVLLGSRGEEAWLAPGTFADNLHRLEGLDSEAASDLADAVLRRAGTQSPREELAFKDLMRLLAGYPLALQVVLHNLVGKAAAEVLDELRRGLAGLDEALGTDPILARMRSLMACIEYSHGHLDPEAQALLLCLAPFAGAVDRRLTDAYGKQLAAEPTLAGLPLAWLGEVLERARELGLLQRDTDDPELLRLQPALGWFLMSRLAAEEQSEHRQAIERAFRRLYDDFADAIRKWLTSKGPKERQLGRRLAEREYTNLGTALRLALDSRPRSYVFTALCRDTLTSCKTTVAALS